MKPRILIACPTYAAKEYALDRWIDTVNEFTYPLDRRSVFMADNSTGISFSKMLKERGISNVHIRNYHKPQYARLAEALEACRKQTLHLGYDYMFSLESDIYPHRTVIDDLLSCQKRIVGFTYFIGQGYGSKLMVQLPHGRPSKFLTVTRFLATEANLFLDRQIKQVYHIGLGCLLIHKSVLKDIRFRYEPGVDAAPDSFFAIDCWNNQKLIWCDTSRIVEHDNQAHEYTSLRA